MFQNLAAKVQIKDEEAKLFGNFLLLNSYHLTLKIESVKHAKLELY